MLEVAKDALEFLLLGLCFMLQVTRQNALNRVGGIEKFIDLDRRTSPQITL